MPLATGNDLNHLALNVAAGTYEVLKADLEKHGVVVSGRPGEDRCIYFSGPRRTPPAADGPIGRTP